MNIVFLILGTVLALSFITLLFKGEKYDGMLEPLEGDDFPFKTIYSVGLALQDTKFGRLQGSIGDKLRKDTTLIYSKKYSEFYARIIWAQILSFVLLALSVALLLASLSGGSMSSFYIMMGIACSGIFAWHFLNHTKDKVDTRKSECETEFPNAVTKLALIVNSGVILHDAWKKVAYGNTGMFYDMMQKSCEDMDNGKADIDAIYEFGTLTNSDDIKKFTSALIQSIERGGGDLPQFLSNQTSELWSIHRQKVLQKGEKAAGELLIPISLMFGGILLIVISAALSSFSM